MSKDGNNELDGITLLIMYYFISQLNGVLGHTHLQKLMFLTDLLASKRFGEPISKMKYVRYNHGPYSKDFNTYIDSLTKLGVVEDKKFSYYNNPEEHYYRFYDLKKVNVKGTLVKEIGPESTLLLDEVVQSYGNKSLQQVLDFVYSLEEVKDAEYDSPIVLAKQQHTGEPEEDYDTDFPF